MNQKLSILFLTVLIPFLFSSGSEAAGTKAVKKAPSPVISAQKSKESVNPLMSDPAYKNYIAFFEQIYKVMQDNYYQPVKQEEFDRFVGVFNKKIYAQLKETGKSIDFIKWRSAAFLVDFLKSKEDIFSALFPPAPAKEYKQTALGQRIDIGIEGHKTPQGYVVDKIEPRSDSYIKGLREQDMILALETQKVSGLEDAKIHDFLNPLINSEVRIDYQCAADQQCKQIKVKSQEYFKQTVFPFPTILPQVYGLKVENFNRMTSEDMLRFMEYFRQKGEIKGLILDMRNNPGGPPLSAREISSFFLPGGDQFAYFHKKGFEPGIMDVPVIPERFKYHGPLVIWINKQSGSASELFSGILQRKGRAVLMGANSAGQVMLKSMFNLDDGSMLLLITARGYHADGIPFSFEGLTPDKTGETDDELMENSLKYIEYINVKKIKI
ncbi:MAG: hypothetical protein HQL26_08710 [Candidatus Omnitrophica bacterium]|nr:hypothetical protein [Candidatus Omnitrophota bacterium]